LLAATLGCGAAMLGAATFTACTRAPRRIAFVGGLTGRHADLGQAGRDAVQLALEQAGAAGEPFTLDSYDTASDLARGREQVGAMLAAGHRVAIGPMTSAIATSMLPAANAGALVLVSPTVSTARLGGIDDHFFRVVSSVRDYAEVSARHHVGKAGWRRFVVLLDEANSAYTRSWLEHFAAAIAPQGGRISREVPFTSDRTPDHDALAAQALQTQADAVLLVCSAFDGAQLAQALRKRDAEMALVSSEWAATEEFLRLAGRAAEGMLVSQFLDRDSVEPAYLAFVDAFSRRFSRPPGFAEAAAFDAATVVLATLRQQRDGESFKSALGRLRRFQGLQQAIEFDDTGDARRAVFLTRVVGNRFVTLRG
jgi:branched-chain amino acid transport system substrate-binding protein